LGSFGVTATASELNHLDGITSTAAELNYLHSTIITENKFYLTNSGDCTYEYEFISNDS
jgi:hypothetical protein